MAHKIFLYPGWIRIWHLLNAILCLVLIATGISMQYSDPGNGVMSFSLAVKLHNLCGVFLSVNYLFFFTGNLFNKNGNYYKIQHKGFIDRLRKQLIYYTFGLFKGQKAPFPITANRKFNPLQQFTYSFVMYVGVPLIMLSGWIMLFPELVLPHFTGLNGVLILDIIHILFGFIISLFMIIHIYFCTIGSTTTSNFKSMINGWHETHD